ncbi:MAG TPA: hypothetical protein PLD84_10180 [Chitinophagales bacterium]|nr:hypothetical protein [Chitinophagales bacterium]
MIEFIKDLFGFAKDSRGLVKDVQDEKSKARGVKNRILTEIEFNIDLIFDHYLEKEIPVEKVIEKLKVEQLAKAIDEGFDFKKMKKGKIDLEMTGDNLFLKKYIGYDCEAFLRKIRHHIEQIKLLPELYNLTDEKKVNAKQRLENLGKRYILFTRYLKTGT